MLRGKPGAPVADGGPLRALLAHARRRPLGPIGPAYGRPIVVVLIDAEEDFDWTRPFSRDNQCVASLASQPLAHRVFERFGVVPTYLIDYPVAVADLAISVLGPLVDDGAAEIGAQLHPWVNPPHDEEVCIGNSYPGNLAPALERAKLVRLTRVIEDRFGRAPTAYKAGRYGLGAASAALIEELGYRIDTSVMPHTDYSDELGPDFRGFTSRPFWFGRRRPLLELPISRGFAGALRRGADPLDRAMQSPFGRRVRLPAALSRGRLLERITLTPEGIDPGAQRRLVRSLRADGQQVFTFAYHSPSLMPGNTPYVRTTQDLLALLRNMEAFFEFFMGELGGEAMTPEQLYRRALAEAAPLAQAG